MRSIGLSLYEEKAKKSFGDKKSFSADESAHLAKLRAFLFLSDADVDRVHVPLAREAFLKVVSTEFGKQKTAEGGVVTDAKVSEAARTAIRAAAVKLGLSDDARDDLLGEALGDSLEPQLEGLKTQYRRVTMSAEEKAKTSKDEGDDPFIKGRKEGLMIKTERNVNLMVRAGTVERVGVERRVSRGRCLSPCVSVMGVM